MGRDELLKKEVEEYLSIRPTPGEKDFIVYKVKVGENTFAYVVEHKHQLSFSDWVKMYEGTELECYRAVGYLDSAVNFSERIEKLEKENELFKKANEIIAQQRDERDADIATLEGRIEELEQRLEKETVNHRILKEEAKAIMNIGFEGIKRWGIVAGYERPFEKEAEKFFNLFLDQVERFSNEGKNESTGNQEGSNEQDL